MDRNIIGVHERSRLVNMNIDFFQNSLSFGEGRGEASNNYKNFNLPDSNFQLIL